MSSPNETTMMPLSLADALARWRKTVEGELKGADFEKKLVTRTLEGVALQPLYTRQDVAAIGDLDTPPGTPPGRRGARAPAAGGRT